MNDNTSTDADAGLFALSDIISVQDEHDQPDLCRQCANVDLASIASGQSSKSYQLRYVVANRATSRLCGFIFACLDGRGAVRESQNIKEGTQRILLHHTVSEPKPDLGALRIILQDGHTSYGMNLSGSSGSARGRALILVTIPSIDCIDFKRVLDWVARCGLYHGDACAQRTRVDSKAIRALEGFRVINCDTKTVVPLPEGCVYAALSYVWGRAGTMPQSSSQPLSQVNSLSEDSILILNCVPKTVEDAMEVVRRLGMTYLWVDKYCIDQANPLQMHAQLSAMDIIYESAYLTIVAAAGDAFSGLPGVTTTPRSSRSMFHEKANSWVDLSNGWGNVKRSLWSSRAWTYQEGICSIRKLVFTDEQVLFECDLAGAQETDGPEDDLLPSHHSQKGLSLLDRTLVTHISQYSRRQLSYQSDVLNAMRGIFERFTHLPTPTLQYWGIPTHATAYGSALHVDLNVHDWFLVGLLWLLDGEGCTQRRRDFPSWSWAGWIAPVKWPSWTALPKHVAIRAQEEGYLDQELTESVVRRSNSARHLQLSSASPVLRIRANVRRLTPEFGEGVIQTLSSTTRAVIIAHPLGIEDEWDFNLTAHVKKGNEIWQALRFQTLLRIIVSQEYALVVGGHEEVKIKIGVLIRRRNPLPREHRRYDPITGIDSGDPFRFANAMTPAEEGTILLG